jgi:hypothetical protein
MTPTLFKHTHGILRSTSNYQKLETMKDAKAVAEFIHQSTSDWAHYHNFPLNARKDVEVLLP